MAPFGIHRNHTYDDFVADLDLILDTFDTESGPQLRDMHEAPVAKELDEGPVRFNAEAPTKCLGADVRKGTVAGGRWGDPDWNRRCGWSAPSEPEPSTTKGFGVREDRALDRLRIGVRGEGIEQFGDIHPAVDRRQVRGDAKPSFEESLGEQVEPARRSVEDEYLTGRKQVKGAVKSALWPPRPLRQGPQLAKLAEDEKLHERERAKLKLRQAGDQPDTQKPCYWQLTPVSSRPPTDTAKTPTVPASDVQPTQPPLPSASQPASASAQPASSAASAANRPSNLPAIDSNICRRKTVYVQIYGPAQRDAVRQFRPVWQALGASVPPIENVNDAARRAGRPDPKPVSSTIVRYHDEGSRACADAIAQNASGNGKLPNWKVERLSARLQPTPGNIEVWIAPDAPIVAKPVPTQ
jgi:hypothetical protein